ncbi:MAG: hypothetical protein VX436_01070 [Planctomycetota bacterium]|nr:hypothetical protein [Planctomycetota bacterium]
MLDILRSSMLYRRNILMKRISLLLVFVIPFCCCAINNLVGAADTCSNTFEQHSELCSEEHLELCSDEIESTHDSHHDHEEEDQPCSESLCCIKSFTIESNVLVLVEDANPGQDSLFSALLLYDSAEWSAPSVELHPPPWIASRIFEKIKSPSIQGGIILQV